jgi:ATP-binding cassette subfamily B protein
MARFFLDAMLGLVPVRVHGAERAVRGEHEGLMTEWARASRSLVRAALTVEALQLLGTYGITIALVVSYLARTARPEMVLLLTYWALKVPATGTELGFALRQYPRQRNAMLRLLEPLGAPEAELAPDEAPPVEERAGPLGSQRVEGVDLRMDRLTVVAAGHPILEDVSLHLPPASHVAVVGASGAGKSSLVGTLLGWYRAASGRIFVDGRPLTARELDELRRVTVWVDPGVYLWNRTLLENLRYGAEWLPASYASILEAADLHGILEGMPDGLQTSLGEGGGFVSGGEGQRVRFARGLLRSDARLVILDEPFRGLDRSKRRLLLERARSWFAHATLLCITHDVEETLGFDRVLVVDGGRLVEDGAPSELAEKSGRYRALLEAERRVRARLWDHPAWRRARIEAGALIEDGADDRRTGEA